MLMSQLPHLFLTFTKNKVECKVNVCAILALTSLAIFNFIVGRIFCTANDALTDASGAHQMCQSCNTNQAGGSEVNLLFINNFKLLQDHLQLLLPERETVRQQIIFKLVQVVLHCNFVRKA